MIARDAARAASPPPPPPPAGPSFLRRHPLLAGFGVLAALSLFAAYWPASAIVTGVVVAARASGVDRAALSMLQRAARRVVDRVRGQAGDGRGPERGTPEPAAPAPDPPVAAEPPVAGPSPSPVAVTPPPAAAGPAPAPRPRRPRPAVRARERTAQRAGVEVER